MIQDIKRVAVYHSTREDNTKEGIANLVDHLHRLSMQVQQINSAIQCKMVSVGAGAASVVVTLPAPLLSGGYCMSVVPEWNTTVWVSAVTGTGFTANFGTVAPGGGSQIHVIVVA